MLTTKSQTPLRVFSEADLTLSGRLSNYQIRDLNPECATKLVNGQLSPLVPEELHAFIGRFGDTDLSQRLDLRRSNVLCLFRQSTPGCWQLVGVLIVILTLPTPVAAGNLRVTICVQQSYEHELEESVLQKMLQDYATLQEWEFQRMVVLWAPCDD